MKPQNRTGFTLIEVLIAAFVIGILAALVLPKLLPVKEKAYVTAMKNSISKAVEAEETYMDKNDVYADETDLATGTGFEADDNVTLAIVPEAADAKLGYVITATHSKTDKACGIKYGSDGTNEYNNKIVCADDVASLGF